MWEYCDKGTGCGGTVIRVLDKGYCDKGTGCGSTVTGVLALGVL